MDTRRPCSSLSDLDMCESAVSHMLLAACFEEIEDSKMGRSVRRLESKARASVGEESVNSSPYLPPGPPAYVHDTAANLPKSCCGRSV